MEKEYNKKANHIELSSDQKYESEVNRFRKKRKTKHIFSLTKSFLLISYIVIRIIYLYYSG
ncbi:hypothetical protein ONB76_00460 [Candidatus Karelsulcia muelleri]|uniref:hypothetical protein n=1 Tax=Candidatus Karelsulcia muelleri TaxID=336810 RepID=UPI00236467C8|nr:hypothetical protein [Candidatus Karelsulcia muelleri]WDE42275.1 hypothetical protein ONB78_00420 [Candidatus Karelsulcia muelleri]WDI79569.1 hypothetical protein ONB75_00170 [Candidatus Karelsulcia muelleri]WDR78890.1 hypothetical protein ONB76_00460 [Candidatus Karelsulcia muelleri]WDR79124.1 hypothetical protein ONB77_00205 [Candidatus Karelsulcia muelleri]